MSINILFVDDNEGITNMLTRLFRQSQYSITVANSGKQALKMMNEKPFTLIVSDQHMPGMCGELFLEKAHQRQPQAVKAIFSGDYDQYQKKHKENIVKYFIPKPCFDDELVDCIEGLVQYSIEEPNKVV